MHAVNGRTKVGPKMTIVWLVGGVLLALALVYAGLLAWMYTQQERLLFHPTRLSADHRFDLPGVNEVSIPVPGATLSALHFQQPNPKGVVFFLHGNAGDLSTWLPDTLFYRRVGYDVFMIDYRGYGKSTGRIESEAQLQADVRAAWDWVAPRYAGKKRVIYGRSLGSGLAAKLAADVPSDLLVLVTPFSSVRDATSEAYPWVPIALLRYPLRTDQVLPHVPVPVLMFEAGEDAMFSAGHAQRLLAVRPDATLVRIPGAGHGDIHQFPLYLQTFAARLEAL